jgi:hypothetical protein
MGTWKASEYKHGIVLQKPSSQNGRLWYIDCDGKIIKIPFHRSMRGQLTTINLFDKVRLAKMSGSWWIVYPSSSSSV